MLKEKSIYESWQKRFSYPLGATEDNASKELAKIKAVRSVSWNHVQLKAKQHGVLVLGDDAMVTSQAKILPGLLIKLNKSNQSKVFITNRPMKAEKELLSFLRKHRFTIQTISASTFQAQTKKLTNSIKRAESKFDQVFVWTGHLRLSSKIFQKLLQKMNPFYLYLQSNELRWRFPNKKGWIVFQNSAANLDTSPLLSLSLFDAMDEKNAQVIFPQNIEKEFSDLTKAIHQQLKLKKPIPPSKILHVFTRQKIRDINRTQNRNLLRFYEDRVLAGESATMPAQKTVLLSSLLKSHLVEEAAHHLRLSGSKEIFYSNTAVIIEEGLAFFASLLICPNRKIPAKPKRMNAWEYVHHTGYSLGLQLYKAWNRSAKNKNKIRQLWQAHVDSETQAKMMLVQLMGIK